MDLLNEYRNQNDWREWQRYLKRLPLNKEQIVYDIGCSIGSVSKLFSKKVKKVVGYDNNEYLLKEAIKEKENNCEFVLKDILDLNPVNLEKCDGIWMSFVLAYMDNPSLFISNWVKCLNHGGWFAIVDIDNLFSGHLSIEDKYFNQVQAFEYESEKSKVYDFKIGGKIKGFMEENGLEIIIAENDWYDSELNFNGEANEDIIKNWKSRLERMVNLKNVFGVEYDEFCTQFINTISKESHISKGCVKFFVGLKR